MNTTAENSRSIWHNSDFVKFFLSFTIGNLGDWFDFFALQIIVVHRFGGSPVEVSLLIVVYMLPFALFSVFSGIVVDRLNKKWLLFFTDFFSGLLTLGMLFAPKIIILMPLIFIRSTISNFNSPSQQAAVKQLVTPEQLLKASSYSAIAFQLCRILGPLLGAVVIAHYSARLCLSINAASFFISAVILLFMRAEKLGCSASTEQLAEQKGIYRQISYAYQIIIKSRVLTTTIPVMLIAFALIMMAEAQTVILLHHIFPARENLLGYIVGISGLGSVLVGVFLSKREGITYYWRYLMIGFLVAMVGYFLMASYQAHWYIEWLYCFAFLQGAGFGAIVILSDYILKREIPTDVIGRVFGILSMAQGSMFLVGALGSGIITTLMGPRVTFFTVGASCLLLALITACNRKNLIRCRDQS